jgi:hypothetical protein
MKGMIDAYAVGGNGGSMAIRYWDFLKIPNISSATEKELASYYYNNINNNVSKCKNIYEFEKHECEFNKNAGIYELDASLKHLQTLLSRAIDKIADDVAVDTVF